MAENRAEPPAGETADANDRGRRAPQPSATTRRRLFGSLCSLVFLVNLARVVFAPLLEPLMGAFAITEGTAGLIVTLVWVGSALPRIPTGYLLTRVPRHRVVLGTGIVLTVSCGITAAANSVFTLGSSALLMGLASGAYFIAANPLVSELYPERVGRAIGIHGMASQVAAVVAPLFVGAILLVAGWRTVFLTMGVVAFAVTVVLYQVAKRATLPNAGGADRDLLAAFARQWPIILSAVAIGGAVSLVWNGLFNFYPKYMMEAKGLSPSMARNLLTVVFGAGVPAFWLTGILADRVPHVPLMLSVVAAYTAALFALTFTSGVVALVVLTALIGYIIHSLFPALDTYLLASIPDENRASAYAIFSGIVMLFQSVGSWVVGLLLEADLPYDTIFRGSAAGLAAILLALIALYVTGYLPEGGRT